MTTHLEIPYIEDSEGNARVIDDVVNRSSGETFKDESARLEEIAEIHADYIEIFGSGKHEAKDLALVLQIAELDVEEGVLSPEDFKSFVKVYEAQIEFEGLGKEIVKCNTITDIALILDTIAASHSAGLITNEQYQHLVSRADTRKNYIKYLDSDTHADDGRYGD